MNHKVGPISWHWPVCFVLVRIKILDFDSVGWSKMFFSLLRLPSNFCNYDTIQEARSATRLGPGIRSTQMKEIKLLCKKQTVKIRENNISCFYYKNQQHIFDNYVQWTNTFIECRLNEQSNRQQIAQISHIYGTFSAPCVTQHIIWSSNAALRCTHFALKLGNKLQYLKNKIGHISKRY